MTSQTSVQAVIFDMGGVLVNFNGGGGLPPRTADWRGRRAMLRLAEDRGSRSPRWSEDDLEHKVFAPWHHEHMNRYERGREASWTPYLDRLRQAYQCEIGDEELLSAWFRPYQEELNCTAAARPVLSSLVESGTVCGLVSNVPLPGAIYRPVLGAGGLGPLLTAYCFSYDEGVRKPSPAIVRRALAALGVEPEQAVLIGDRRSTDVAAGLTAGVRTVWLRSEFADGPEPDAIIDRLDQLPSLLAEWRGPAGDSE